MSERAPHESGTRLDIFTVPARALGAALALLVAALALPFGAAADDAPATSKLVNKLPPMPFHQVAASAARVQLGNPPPIRQVMVSDDWASRYDAAIILEDGTAIYYEKTLYPYSTAISLTRAFYEVFGPDEILAEQGIAVHLDSATSTTSGGRPVAYVTARGKDMTCFAFLSQFGAARDQMLHARACRGNDERSPQVLAGEWLALLERLAVD